MDLDALDRALAEKVMGWRRCELTGWATGEGWEAPEDAPDFGWKCSMDFWQPTRNIAQAMQVFEQMAKQEDRIDLTALSTPEANADYRCYIWAGKDWRTVHPIVAIGAETPALAICLAAAKKYGIEVQ